MFGVLRRILVKTLVGAKVNWAPTGGTAGNDPRALTGPAVVTRPVHDMWAPNIDSGIGVVYFIHADGTRVWIGRTWM